MVKATSATSSLSSLPLRARTPSSP
jgi:hypothetical protein